MGILKTEELWGKIFPPSSKRHNEYGVHQASYRKDTRLPLPEVKRPVLVAKRLVSFSAEVRNPWSYASSHNTTLWPGA